MASINIEIRGAAENNLKEIDVDLPRGRWVAITGVSGSGKTSLAFDTVYAEARRRFLLSLGGDGSLAAKMPAPRVASVKGLSPAAAIGQERARRDPRATVGTLCGVYDFLRLLFAQMGRASCLACGGLVAAQRFEEVWETAVGLPPDTKLVVLAPRRPKPGETGAALLAAIDRGGYRRLRLDGKMVLLEELDPSHLKGKTLEVVVDRLVTKPGTDRRLRGSLQAALEEGEGQVVLLEADGGWEQRFAVRPSCTVCAAPFLPITPTLFSFNSVQGACAECRGLGAAGGLDAVRVFAGGQETLEGALGPLWRRFGRDDLRQKLEEFCRRRRFDTEVPLGAWEPGDAAVLWDGEKRRGGFVGLRRWLERLHGKAEGEEQAFFDAITAERQCQACHGTRLRPEALAVRIDGQSLADWAASPLEKTVEMLTAIAVDARQRPVYEAIAQPLQASLDILQRLGLDYLVLSRRADTLSSGEFQRLRLAAVLGLHMTHMLYVLDEPSAGLHARDAERLATVLEQLRDSGNTVVVVEHDPALIARADWVVDIGPEAGAQGGQVVGQGTPEQVAAQATPTGRYLAGQSSLGRGAGRPIGVGGWLHLQGASGHNLETVDVKFPLGNLVCVTGVSGSGKSSLVHGTLYPLLAARLQGGERPPLPFIGCQGVEQIERVVAVDQRPIGRTPRSNAATYTGVFAMIRRLFAEIPQARLRGYTPGHFSFNAAVGACESCGGSGLEAGSSAVGEFSLVCGACSGRRYRSEVLDVRYRDHSIADMLDLTVKQAGELFAPVPDMARRLGVLADVGLGYLKLGQPATSLSGGEAQRVKLAAELGRPRQTHTLYVLDEPTTGLHVRDVAYLLELLQRLVDGQNTVIVVEHHIELVAAADYVIDLGPESGAGGGQVIACGDPLTVAATAGSHTGRYLAALLAEERI